MLRRGLMLRVALIFGGESDEHEVSVASALSILDNHNPDEVELRLFAVSKDGSWLTHKESVSQLNSIRTSGWGDVTGIKGDRILNSKSVLQELGDCDVAFPVIHGRGGEDGRLQGFLDSIHMPYVGSGVTASASAMDKELMRALFAANNIRQPAYRVVRKHDFINDPQITLSAVSEELQFPLFTKPANGGSSIGVSKVGSKTELSEAAILAFKYDEKILIEEAIVAREIECGVLEGITLQPTCTGEIISSSDFYDYEQKYKDSGTRLIVPADLSQDISIEIQTLAMKIFRLLGARSYARVDFLLTETNDIYCLEINTSPGFTTSSMFPILCENSGVAFKQLITRLAVGGEQTSQDVRPHD